jgi:putative inorganic carbon (HCO3(-)) transporter
MMMLVSLYATYDINFSLPKIAGVILGLGLFFSLVRLAQAEKGLWIAIVIFFTTGSVIAGVSFLGMRQFEKFALLTPIISHLPAAITGFPGAEAGFHPNQVAGALLWVLPMFLSLTGLSLILIFKNSAKLGWCLNIPVSLILLVVTLFMIGEFLLTQSRGGFIALASTMVLLCILSLRMKWRWFVLGSLAVMGISLGLVVLRMGWANKLVVNVMSGGALASSINSLAGRIEIWSRAIYGIQDFPFTGMGMNTFRKVVHVLYPLFSIGPEVDIGHAHNEFLQAALDLGVPGMIAFLSLYLVSLWMLMQVWSWASGAVRLSDLKNLDDLLTSSAGIKALVLGLGGGLLAHAIFGLTDAVALGAKPGILFWMLLGLVAGLYQKQIALRCRDDRLDLY